MIEIRHKNNIMLHDGDYKYFTPEGERYRGVTSVISTWFPKFDKIGMAYKCSVNKKRKEYFGKKPAEIIAGWDENSAKSIKRGNDIHKFIEDWCNPEIDDLPSVEGSDKLEEYLFELLANREVIGCEIPVFSPKYRIMAIIDILMRDKETNNIIIGDWKTNKAIKKSNYFQKGLGELSSLDDCEYHKYGLQLNLIQFILEEEGYYEHDVKYSRNLYHIQGDAEKIEQIPISLKPVPTHIILAAKLANLDGCEIDNRYLTKELLGGYMAIPGKRTQKKKSFASISKFIYGPSKCGKSTLASCMKDGKKEAYFITSEDNHDHLNIMAQRVTNWTGFIKLIGVLEKNAKELQETYSCIVVDLVSDFGVMCTQFVCDEYKVDSLGEISHGKGWAQEKTEFQAAFNRLLEILPIVSIDHDREKKFVKGGEEYSQSAPLASDRVLKYVNGKSPLLGYIKIKNNKSYLTFKPSDLALAGSHFMFMTKEEFFLDPTDVSGSYKKIEEFYNNGGK